MRVIPAYPSPMTTWRQPTLASIITAARAGSLDHASALFSAGGFDQTTDPAALAVAGRLAKDRALRLPRGARSQAFADAAALYARAHAIDPQPYTAINRATLMLLAGDEGAAREQAQALLDRLDHGPAPAETPYWIAATRAEALLLLDRQDEAAAMLGEAIACAPDCHDDQAATLRQLGMILAQRGASSAWLDAFRPPLAMNFAGHLAIGPDAIEALQADVADILAAHRVGAGFGALAAGADLVISEALLNRGAALHAILPCAPEVFRAQSVDPYGAEWSRRFDRAMAEAASVRTVSQVSGGYEPLATRLAADVAMGASVRHARQLETGAVQLLMIDDGPGRFGLGAATAYLGERWREGPQVCMVVPRTAPVVASGSKAAEGRTDRSLDAMLHIAFDGLDALDDAAFAEALDTMVAPFRAAAERIVPQPDRVLPAGNARIVAFADPDDAWAHAAALLALPEAQGRLRIAAHFALVHRLDMPPALVGAGVAALNGMAPLAMPGTVIASDTFAAAVFVNQSARIHAEEVGEWRGDRLFALIPREEDGGACQ